MMNLLSLSFWFQLQPPMFLGWIGTVLLIVFSLMAVIGLAVKIYGAKSSLEKYRKRAVQKAGSLLLTMGLAGLMFYFFTYERLPILSMRIWLMVWLGVLVLWTWSIYQFIKIEIPRVEALRQEREKLEKWLPKKK
ncbi:MAG TPA: hypothetical protein PLF71_00030 [bacterium]|nr:hypothetical protein [bacterium]